MGDGVEVWTIGLPAACRLAPAVARHSGDVSASVEGWGRSRGGEGEDDGLVDSWWSCYVAMVIVIVEWFMQDCAAGKRPLKKRPTCSHAEMQSPCEHVGRSLQWNQYDGMDFH